MLILSTYHFDDVEYLVCLATPAPTARRGRPGWTKVSKFIWQHASGWQVQDCGHPTANWPYTCAHRDGRTLVTPSGRGFQRLAEAQAACEGT